VLSTSGTPPPVARSASCDSRAPICRLHPGHHREPGRQDRRGIHRERPPELGLEHRERAHVREARRRRPRRQPGRRADPDPDSGGKARVWRTASGELAWQLNLKQASDELGSISFSPDDKLVAASRAAITEVWDIASGDQIATLRGHTDAI
jgi:WD40 repeat protein